MVIAVSHKIHLYVDANGFWSAKWREVKEQRRWSSYEMAAAFEWMEDMNKRRNGA